MPTSFIVHNHKVHASAFTDEFLFHQLIPYIGNKRKLLGLIDEAVRATEAVGGTFCDFFAGGGVVSRYAKKRGFAVLANDWEPYAHCINGCYIACNEPPPFRHLGGPDTVFNLLNSIPPIEDYITRNLCPESDENPRHDLDRLFFTRANGMRIDAIRGRIYSWKQDCRIDDREEMFLLAALLYGVSYVSNTSGVFKGFHRGWGGATQTAHYRILSDLKLRKPVLFDNERDNEVIRSDAQHLAQRLEEEDRILDIAYLDPPYNQHPYGSNYHVLNTVALWDKPDIPLYDGKMHKSAIRTDWRTERRSAYNHSTATEAYRKLIQSIKARFILTSYSTDGNIPVEEMFCAASEVGQITCVMNPYKRYRVSAQRMSRKPMNVEFVLTIDTSRPSRRGAAMDLVRLLKRTEDEAITRHASNQ
jgi:adenine-specific DNA-methyltransferase